MHAQPNIRNENVELENSPTLMPTRSRVHIRSASDWLAMSMDYGHFAYETLHLQDSSPTARFAYGHRNNRYPAIRTAAVSIVITQFLLHIGWLHFFD